MVWTAESAISAVSSCCDTVFLAYLPLGHRKLVKTRAASAWRWLAIVKAFIGVFLAISLQLYLAQQPGCSGQSSCLNFKISLGTSTATALALGFVLYQEHGRLSRPSDLVSVYLTAATLLDVVALTAPNDGSVHQSVLLLRCLGHLVLLILESFGPRGSPSSADATDASPEEQSGIFGRAFFLWINPVLREGYHNVLVGHELPRLRRDIRPGATRKAMLQAWSQRARPETRLTLPLALLKCLKRPFLGAVIPRLCLTVFQYSQPVLIKHSIRYVSGPLSDMSGNYGYWLVVSAVVVYGGLALSSAIYQNRLNRLKILTQSALIGLIHDKTVSSPSAAYDNGEAITLMSTDVGDLDGAASMFHETWAYFIDVLVGVSLLIFEVGWVWLWPMFLLVVSSRMSRYVALNLRSRQRAWNEATQRRAAAITSMLSSMKMVKMLGFQHHLARRAQALRVQEMQAASKVRWMNVYYNASANMNGIYSPAVTIIIFAVIAHFRGQRFDAETAFTTMAVLSMVTHPANMLMTIVPRAIAAFAGFDRIQNYLLRPLLQDNREVIQAFPAGPNLAIRIRGLTLGEKQPPLLRDMDIDVSAGCFVVVSGFVGCGKSTLLRAMLGEVTPVQGNIDVSTRHIAYSGQRPWLPGGSIKEAIIGSSTVDSRWYGEVIEACCLNPDLDALSEGDETQVGSGGLNLSGGQRQRVALARAVYARNQIVLLDDPFSALDGETETKIFANLFGPEGLFRKLKAAVVLVTNSTQSFSAADHIIILGEGGIKEQGPWETIQEKSAAISKFIPSSHSTRGDDRMLSVPSRSKNSNNNIFRLSAQLRARDEAAADLNRKTGDFSLYKYYIGFLGIGNLFLSGSLTGICAVFVTLPQYWLKLWTESENGSTAFYASGLFLMAFLSWFGTSAQVWSTLTRMSPHSGLRFHQRLLDLVMGATLFFFSQNDSGSVLNRFSQDIQLVDKQLPTATIALLTQIFKLSTQIVLLLTTQKFLVLSLPLCTLVVYFVQKVYLRTSRQLRLLELETRAAVFSNFLESVDGIETIRSFGWKGDVVRDNVVRLESSQRPEFMLACLQRWLNMVLDLMSAAIAISVIALAVVLRGRVSGGQVGVGLNVMLVANKTILSLVLQWTTLEVSLGAVSRLKTLEKTTPQEVDPDPSFETPSDWPGKGAVTFSNVAAVYGDGTVALKDFDLSVLPGQRVVLCGRTGSGKSSVLLSLLRILDTRSGNIQLDGIGINNITRDVLRQKCFITVSQDALLLPGETLRFNLDPDLGMSDEALTDALEKLGLWSHFRGNYANGTQGEDEYREHPILDAKISIFPELSAGQGQLFAMCRAVLRAVWLRDQGAKPVILLDEVTSSLDAAIESTVHGIIDEEFSNKGHTVIMVSHRLGGLVKDARQGDVVVWMKDGRVHDIVHGFQTQVLGVEED